MLLLDTNVWLAAAFEGHVHHPIAKAWFDGLTDDVCLFCRLTQQSFLRLSSNPAVLKQDVLTLSEAWQVFDLLAADPRVAFSEEPQGILTQWRKLTERESYSPHVWNDAYLAAFAISGGMELVAFDKGLLQYESLACMVLS